MAELDQLTVSTHRYVRETPELVDMVFQGNPLTSYAKLNLRDEYTGGRFIGENFVYNGLIGGAYLPGADFDITEPQIEQELQFLPKYFETNITFQNEEIEVVNRGPAQIFPLVKSRTESAYMTIGAHIEIAMFLSAQYSSGNTNLAATFNGLPEAVNDNSTASWDGNTYSTYGTITRGGAVGTALNSTPTNVNGTIEYNTLEETYMGASYGVGNYEPNLGVTTPKCYSFVKERFQPQQRFNDTQDPKIGFKGLAFNDAVLMKTRYCPGSYLFGSSGTADPIATTFIRQTSRNNSAAYPVPASYTSGAWETLWWLNARKPFMNWYMSDNPKYQFGVSGFKPAQGNNKVACQVFYSGAVTFAPRYHAQLYGITG